MSTLISNAGRGITGLTSTQRRAGANQIVNAIQNGQVSPYLLQDDSMIQDYLGGYKNLASVASMAQVIESMGKRKADGTKFTIFDVESLAQNSEDYKEIEQALLAAGFTMGEMEVAIKGLNQEMFIDGITALNLYGDATERVTSLMQQWAGTTEDVAKAMKDLVSQMTQLSQNEYWRNRYNSEISNGTLSIETAQAVAQMLGVNEDFVIANEAAVTAMLGLTGQGDKETLGTLLRGMDVYLNDAAVQDALVETEAGSGVYDLTSSVDALEALPNNANAQMLLQLLPLLELFTGGNVLIKTETRQVAVNQTVAEPEQPQSGTSGVGDGTQEPVVVSGVQNSGEAAVVTGEAAETEYEERTYYTFQTPQTITPYAPMFYDTELNNVLQSNYGFGVESLSPQTRLALGSQMRQIVAGGNIGAFMANSGLNTRQTYASLYTNAAEYMHLAKLVDDMEGDYDLEQLTEGSGDIYDDIDEHLRSMGYSAGYALQVIEDLDKEILVGGLRAADAYGDAMEDVAAIIDQ